VDLLETLALKGTCSWQTDKSWSTEGPCRSCYADRVTRAVLVCGTLVYLSCSGVSGTLERRCPDDATELQELQTGLSYQDCDRIVAGCEAEADAGLSTEQALGCFSDAWSSCTPSVLRQLARSDDAPEQYYFIEPDGQGGCRIAVVDERQTDDHDRELSRRLCRSFRVSETCPFVETLECDAQTALCRGSLRP
jgi:hypothetical protein